MLFTGGGTGGHVFPGVAVIEKLREAEPSLDIRWLGSSSPMEQEIIRRFGLPFIRIPSGKLRRYFSLRNLLDLFKIAAGLAVSFVVILRLRPALLFSKGGYVSVPPVIAAHLLKVPVVTHESDLDPGLATRINSRFAETICVPYEESLSYFPDSFRAKIHVTGNPVREEVFRGDRARGRALFAVPEGLPLLLVLGGSQGAREINLLLEQSVDHLTERFFVVHQTGKSDFRESRRQRYATAAFFSDSYPDVLAAADLVVARSGAGTLWELAAQGKPSILIPLSTAFSRGDQVRNAELFVRRGAAVALSQADPGSLLDAAFSLVADPLRLRSMGEAAREIGSADASRLIAGLIRKRIGAGNAARSA